MDIIDLQEHSQEEIQYGDSIENPIIIDDDDSDDDRDSLPPAPAAPTLNNYDSEDDSEDEILVADDYELPFMRDKVDEMDHSDRDEQLHESNDYELPYMEDDDDGSSISESDLCTTAPDIDDYNRICFLHRGYFPRRGTNTNSGIWDCATGILIHINGWKEGNLSTFISVLQKNNKIINLKIVLALPPCHQTIQGVKVLANLRAWDRMDIDAHVSWMEFCYIFPRMNNLFIKFFKKQQHMDDA
uniref:DDE-1 domain-containing protein n=1 Tax=Strongyloides papillosus TaxID=174720 RepID=A0A0N5BDK1_STREA